MAGVHFTLQLPRHFATNTAAHWLSLMKGRPSSVAKAFVRWLAIVSLVIAAIVTFVPVTTTLAVSAIADRVEIVSSGSHTNRWYLSGADYFAKASDKAIPFTGSLDIDPGVRIVIERIGSGPVRITLRPVKPEQAQMSSCLTAAREASARPMQTRCMRS